MKKDKSPKPGWISEVEIVRWKDADTPVVRITREFAVRLVDTDSDAMFDAPEKDTEEGKDAITLVQSLKYLNGKFTVFIPSNQPVELMDINSFERLCGELWFGDKKITDILLENGYGKLK